MATAEEAREAIYEAIVRVSAAEGDPEHLLSLALAWDRVTPAEDEDDTPDVVPPMHATSGDLHQQDVSWIYGDRGASMGFTKGH